VDLLDLSLPTTGTTEPAGTYNMMSFICEAPATKNDDVENLGANHSP
jgi:hypothetical protein